MSIEINPNDLIITRTGDRKGFFKEEPEGVEIYHKPTGMVTSCLEYGVHKNKAIAMLEMKTFLVEANADLKNDKVRNLYLAPTKDYTRDKYIKFLVGRITELEYEVKSVSNKKSQILHTLKNFKNVKPKKNIG